jgi:hypothetical protein
MDLDDLRSWLKKNGQKNDGILDVKAATLTGHHLVWNYYSSRRGAGAANIAPCSGRDLPGLALLVDNETLDGIDLKEGHPRYYDRGRSPLNVGLRGGDVVPAWVYVARPERCSPSVHRPTPAYLRLLIDAAKKHSFPEWYIGELVQTPTVP